jgi:poly[(R)-3-hydroxyalkanoate] polymerase subunit PhaC
MVMIPALGVPQEYWFSLMQANHSLLQQVGSTIVESAVKPQAKAAAFGTWAIELQHYAQQISALWTNTLLRMGGAARMSIAEPEKGDKRFLAQEWRDNPVFDFFKQFYLSNARYFNNLIDSADIDDRTRAQLRFFARQYLDALSPANFASLNPVVLREALKSQGESLLAGLKNLSEDFRRGRISQTDETAFEVGRNLAVTPGSVIFENELVQVIQYAPSGDTVHERPLLMVPPCINKYYLLDLAPENSLVRYAVEQGNTVFMVSWRNVGPEQGHLTWDDYLELGVLQSMAVAQQATGSAKINALGFCVGGTLLGCAAAISRARGEELLTSLTLLTTMLDFSEAGEISLLIDEAGLAAREVLIGKDGIMPGRELDFVFSTLRGNDLIWPYVVSNYMKGQSPDAFDLLYWNSDSTNLPGPMYCWYVRNAYLENKIKVANGTHQCGVPLDLSRIDVPTFLLASREDHIVPWKTAYASTSLVSGPKRFVLAASGHVAGVINPASRNKRNYWTDGEHGRGADHWLANATSIPGSWWHDWSKWLASQGGTLVPARSALGGNRYRPIESAPGRYVKQLAAT